MTHSSSSAELTHVDQSGAAHMVDVSAKSPTARVAVATGVMHTTPVVIGLLRDNAL
jgi:cyclic pyranopterin phosphate synthase